MDRKWKSAAAVAAPALDNASDGYASNGNPGGGIPATVPGAHWYHMVTEEILNAIAGAGIAFDKTVLTQLRDAVILLGAQGAWSTGDVKATYKVVADAGWVLMNDGTIGNAASGGTTRANADTAALFTLLWTNVANAQAAVSGGRGASAAADFAANKTIALPKALGRAVAVYGAGAGLTARVLGFTVGTETHALVTGEMPAHTHTGGVNGAGGIGNGAGQNFMNTGSTGGDGAHNNMPPETFLNIMIKL